MSCPRLEVDLRKVRHNTRIIVERLAVPGIRVTAVTKAVCGHPAIARAMLDGGAVGLAEARLSNVKRLRQAGMACPITLIRTPMLSQVDDVVQYCEASYNTERAVIAALAVAARQQNTVHGIILMVELGDQREGIRPHDLGDMAQHVVDMPGVALKGIGANFACLSGLAPTAAKMQALTVLANDIDRQCGPFLETVSGGNSANLPWALEQPAIGRINDLRLGEAILLGVDPVTGDQIDGLFSDAFTLVAEVIEVDVKSMQPVVSPADRSSMAGFQNAPDISGTTRLILAVGQQDSDMTGLSMLVGTTLIGATSDHLVISMPDPALCVGSEMRFKMGYAALMRATAAPDIQIHLSNDRPAQYAPGADEPGTYLASV
ncbi:alanine/ornithine racemase family PLP-dependent enzyme [Cognatishimia sp. 1_MG-2023]|uniref:alanine/ornithine racemase family PLP-dependent enzyme n=1 Tax=Cognatishimia sp. 1_MG-2023 TaxID=3062642 RepID=UPI0026E3C772|nr:alanine/ornithine racemase family PLP-dependent enzyme [Cognatishimia sp. 1_MG-2023]MDO6726556.1 alanine/ornithine racemase family PLP-dependent enzyme [Cognatishimia sp. 1_MG-2023]